MKRAVLLSVALMSALAWARTRPAALSQDSDQLIHRPLGDASIVPAVVIRGFGATTLAGVASEIAGARHWSAKIRGVPTTLDFGTTVTVRGGMESGPVKTLSSLDIREVRLPATSRWADPGDATGQERFALGFTPRLQSPSYRLEIWNGSTRVFDITGLRSGGVVLSGNDPICDALGKNDSVRLGICEFVLDDCSSLDDEGRFNWTIRRGTPVPWVVPGVLPEPVVGDQIRIVEETPSSPGHIVFKNVAVQGSNLSEMVLMNEMATAAVPASHLPGLVR